MRKEISLGQVFQKINRVCFSGDNRQLNYSMRPITYNNLPVRCFKMPYLIENFNFTYMFSFCTDGQTNLIREFVTAKLNTENRRGKTGKIILIILISALN